MPTIKAYKKDADISVYALKKRITLLQALSKPNYRVSSTIAPCEVELDYRTLFSRVRVSRKNCVSD
jgi:hypothetical protein